MTPSQYPRPEYPRPDRQRGVIEGTDWLNLNGPWAFRFDPDRSGLGEKWQEADPASWPDQILVPFCWESLAAWGEGNAAGNDNYFSTRVYRNPVEVTEDNCRVAERYEVGWYRREVTIPAWTGKRVILTVGAADFFTDCWCNGQHLGRHEGGYTPFEFDITDTLGPDRRAVIVFRVEDPMENTEQPVGKQWGWYTTTSGIWQTVFVEPRGESWVDGFRITTDITARTALFDVDCVNTLVGDELAIDVCAPNGVPMQTLVPVRGGVARANLTLEPFVLWDPFDPQLYRVVLRLLRNGTVFDSVQGYFGARQITTAPVDDPSAPAALVLNGRPIYLRGALYQSYHPEGVYTARDSQRLRDDIAFAKRAGFDFLRVHIKIDDPLLLYYADTVGMLLMCDFPNFGEGGDTPLGRRRYEETMRAAIRRDFNHPSIIAWCTFNETWGFGGQVEFVRYLGDSTAEHQLRTGALQAEKIMLANKSAHEWVRRMWELAKQLDPTRLVEDMSVVHWNHLAYFAHGDTDINSWHFYLNDYVQARSHIEKVVSQTYAGSTFNYVEGFQQGGQPLINSEYGGVGALDGDRDVSWSFKFLTNELRRHSKLSAYIFTELHDVEWERNGFLNYDRTPKEFGYDPLIINQGDVLPVDAPPIGECLPGARVAIPVMSSHYSRVPRRRITLHWRVCGVDNLARLRQDLARGSMPIAFPQYKVAHAHTVEFEAPAEPMLCTVWLQAIDDDGTVAATNFVHVLVSDGPPPAREDSPERTILRLPVAGWSACEWSGGATDAEEAEKIQHAWGAGAGFFEWQIDRESLRDAARLTLLLEASSRSSLIAQTGGERVPTCLNVEINGTVIHRAVLPGHPHDSRGALSYLGGGAGAYGFLAHATVDGGLLGTLLGDEPRVRLRCSVPQDLSQANGLTIYGPRAGRYPLGPTIVVDRGHP